MRSQRKARVGQERRKSENRRSNLKMLCAALLRSFRGLHSEKIKGNPWGNWTLGKANSHFDPTQTKPGTAPPR